MTTPENPNGGPGTEDFRPRTSTMLAFVMWALAGITLVPSLAGGVAGLPAIPLALAVAFAGYWLFWFPKVRLDDDGVTLVNPVRTVSVPWAALITVDTKFALKLLTPAGAYTAWAAPAPGVVGTFRAKPQDVVNLPSSSYGPGGSMRPGDLKHSDSGAAAYLIRTRWAIMIEAGLLDVDQMESAAVLVRYNWPLIGAAVVALLAVALSLSGLG
ncbi:MAG: PH domain-containing protein [Actinomycetota bacterium]|nr:PH domain-containing protein [Actinomycetota bacterium]